MLLCPELRFRYKPEMSLKRLADEIQRADMSLNLVPCDRRGRETHWGPDVYGFKAFTESARKPFLRVSGNSANLALGKADAVVLGRTLNAFSQCVEIEKPDPLWAIFGFVTYMVVFVATLIHISEQYRYEGALGYLIPAAVILTLGLSGLAGRAYRNPGKGRSLLALMFLIPGLFALSPLSLLNVPAVRHLMRVQGYRIGSVNH